MGNSGELEFFRLQLSTGLGVLEWHWHAAVLGTKLDRRKHCKLESKFLVNHKRFG
jgi:hypothetical protein